MTKRIYDKRGAAWTQAEENLMICLHQQGKDLEDISKALGRTPYAIRLRLERHEQMSYQKNPFDIAPSAPPVPPHFNPWKEIPIPPKEPPMIDRTVTTKTFVGHQDAALLNVAQLIDTIEQEQSFIDRLAALPHSKARVKLLEKHKANLTALNELLEKRVDEEG